MFAYHLSITLPINQVFIKAENLKDCVQDALDELLSDGFIHLPSSGIGFTEKDNSDMYDIYHKKGIEYFMKYVSYDINGIDVDWTLDNNVFIQYIVPFTIDVTGLLEGV